jgi:hypothetical protein
LERVRIVGVALQDGLEVVAGRREIGFAESALAQTNTGGGVVAINAQDQSILDASDVELAVRQRLVSLAQDARDQRAVDGGSATWVLDRLVG